MAGTRYSLEVQPIIPERLKGLEELANDLMYSWDRQIRSLFARLDTELWSACSNNPKVFLRRVSQSRLDEAAQDPIYIEDYTRAISAYNAYHRSREFTTTDTLLHPERDLVAYFCAEFGFHESLPIYSGGLGILAGDHCKAASDLGIPFVAIGMLYRQGYFTQTIDAQGQQIAHYMPTNFADLPVQPALNHEGQEIHVEVELPERKIRLKLWRVKAGHIDLYLLDSDLPENNRHDRSITYQLYGGGSDTRILQEIVLGIGGVRAIRALGLRPSAWHINEGHAAFQILERCREHVSKGMDFDSALEMAAAGTIFTTHTPVPAGHDIFDHDLIKPLFHNYVTQLEISMEHFLELGSSPINYRGFNMTSLALRGSRFHNGVSRIHGQVASRMESYIWPQVPHEENPIGHITNGVHLPTFIAREWTSLFDIRFGAEWRNALLNEKYWQRIDSIPNYTYWSVRQSLKSELFAEVKHRLTNQLRRNCCSEVQIDRVTRFLTPNRDDILTLGFARRFATYKRATLLLSDPERLARLVNNPERPMILIFAGKAHPSDQPGQDLIRSIHDLSRRPEFEGRLLLLEGYDIELARKLVAGVDVWVNTPEYPLEASGTSGQKAGMNGVVNLSVLDGWWGEGYTGDNGWAIRPHGSQYSAEYRNHEEAETLLDIIEDDIIPLYYKRNGHGHSEDWIKISKASMKSIIPRYNSQRMVMDYVRNYYHAAGKASMTLGNNDCSGARELARWKRKIRQVWSHVSIRRLDESIEEIKTGMTMPIRVAASLHGLDASDVIVECLIGTEDEHHEFKVNSCYSLTTGESNNDGETLFKIDLQPALAGLQYYKIRCYPHHRLLSHPFETGLMLWL